MKPIIATLFFSVMAACATAPPPATPDEALPQLAPPLSRGELVAADAAETAEGERLEAAARVYQKALEKMFEALAQELDACYLPQLKRIPGLSGHLLVEMTVGRGGIVLEGPHIGDNTLGNAKVESCLMKIISDQTYPEPFNGQQVVVKRTFTFGAF